MRYCTVAGYFLILSALLLGCSREPEDPRSDQGDPSPPSSTGKRIPITDSTLSVLQDTGDGCAWRRIEPVTGREEGIAWFGHTCHGGAISWNSDGTLALVMFNPDVVDARSFMLRGVPEGFVTNEVAPKGARLRLYLVDMTSGKKTELPAPPRGEFSTLGFTGENQVIALTNEFAEPRVDDSGSHFLFEGERYAIDANREGTPILAHAFEWRPPQWVRIETKVSDMEYDLALGVWALDARKTIGSSTWDVLSLYRVGDEVELETLLTELARFAPEVGGEDAVWVELEGARPPVYVWEVAFEFIHPTGLIVLSRGADLIIPPGIDFTASDLVAPLVRGQFLLIATGTTGTHPRLYDLSTATRVYSSESARAAVFWPPFPAAGPPPFH